MNAENKNAGAKGMNQDGNGFWRWLVCVIAWLLCAAMCLLLTVELESWPMAYDMFFPAVLLILFCNILVFLFIGSRWGHSTKPLLGAVGRVCIGEGLLLALFYLLGRFAMGA